MLRTLAKELVALKRSCERGRGGVAHHLADAAQTHIHARSGGLWKRDQVLDRLANLYRSLRRKKNTGRADIPGLTLGLGASRPPDNLKGKPQIETLIFSLFDHCPEFIAAGY